MIQSTKEVTVFNILDVGERVRTLSFFDRGFIVELPVKSLNTRELGMNLVGDRVSYTFGCRTIMLDTIKEEYRILSAPEPITYTVKSLKKKDTKKTATKSPIVDESETYYIAANKKAYEKKDYYVEDETLIVKSKVREQTGYQSGMYYDGYNLGGKKFVIDEMARLIKLGDAVLKFLNKKKK